MHIRSLPPTLFPLGAAKRVTAPLALALALSPAAYADDNSQPDGVYTLSRLETVEVTGRKEQTTFATETYSANKFKEHILDIGQSISIVTKELIQDQGLMRLNDVTPYVAGMNEFSVYNDVTIRGFRNSDDRRVNGLRTYNDFWSQDVIAHVERVEVIKGPAAVAFGDASPGGVVNVVTKKPLDEYRHAVSARVGSFNETYLAVDTTGPISEKLLYRLNIAREDSDSFRDEIFNENVVVAPSLTVLPFETTRINIDYVYIDTKGVLDRGQPNIQGSQNLGEIPIKTSLTQPGDEMSTQSSSFTVSLDQQLTDQWSFALAHNRVDYDQTLEEHRTSGYVTGENGESRISLLYVDRAADAEVSSTSGYFTGEVKTGLLQHKIVFGMDVVESENIQSQVGASNVAIVDLLDPSTINLPRDVSTYSLTAPSWSPYGGKLEATGTYLQDQISIGNWQVMLGLRHDDYEITTVGSDEISADSQLSPRVSALYRLNDNSTVYASWIKGFEPPSPSLNSPEYGGPFDPQESKLLEAGYKQMLFAGKALLVGSIYEITKSNAVVWANDSSNPDLYVQRGEEQARGFELEFSGDVTDKLLLIANYAFNDAKAEDKPKEGAPKHTATLWGRYNLTSQFGFGAGVEYVGERHTFDETLQLPSYTLFNASVFYEPTNNLELAVQAKNLTDETHWTGGYYYSRLYPGNPRTVSLSARYQF